MKGKRSVTVLPVTCMMTWAALSTISILSSMARSKLHNDEVKTSEYINKISDNSLRMMEAMDDIVWAIKPDNDSMQKIVARNEGVCYECAWVKDIELVFHAAAGINDLKLGHGTTTWFLSDIQGSDKQCGKVFEVQKATIQIGWVAGPACLNGKRWWYRVWGECRWRRQRLGNMQKRLMHAKGRLQVLSRPGEGTQVILNIPVG